MQRLTRTNGWTADQRDPHFLPLSLPSTRPSSRFLSILILSLACTEAELCRGRCFTARSRSAWGVCPSAGGTPLHAVRQEKLLCSPMARVGALRLSCADHWEELLCHTTVSPGRRGGRASSAGRRLLCGRGRRAAPATTPPRPGVGELRAAGGSASWRKLSGRGLGIDGCHRWS
jgi:hypothetical protein